jgi:hypothetical protein
MASLMLNLRDESMAGLSVEDLERVVNGRLQGRVSAFQLFLEGQGLVLRGTARTFYAKQMAQHLVMELTTLPIVANGIEVINGR